MPRQGFTFWRDTVASPHHVLCSSSSPEWLNFKTLADIPLRSIFRLVLCNSAMIFVIWRASYQKHTLQLIIHLILCRCALHMLYKDRFRCTSMYFGVETRKQQHFCYLDHISLLFISRNNHKTILRSPSLYNFSQASTRADPRFTTPVFHG